MEDILQNINNQIRYLRIAKKITQQELAERTNLSVPYISQIENSHRNISLETLLSIVQALEISLSDFFLPYSVTGYRANRTFLKNSKTTTTKRDSI